MVLTRKCTFSLGRVSRIDKVCKDRGNFQVMNYFSNTYFVFQLYWNRVIAPNNISVIIFATVL